VLLQGTLAWPGGAPAAGVRVRATRQGELFKEECLGELASPPAEARTDSRGWYRLPLDPGEYRLEYEPDRGTALPVTVEPRLSIGEDVTRDVTLAAPVLAEGRVLSPEGAPLGKAEIRVYAPGDTGASQPRAVATSAADGHFRLVLPGGTMAASTPGP
jgi:hypothetical protein